MTQSNKLTEEQQNILLGKMYSFIGTNECTEETVSELLRMLEKQITEFELLNGEATDA